MHLHDTTHTLRMGAPLTKARGVVILLHGRGSSAEDIAGLAHVFDATDFAYLVPRAANNTWYPHRFLVPPSQNEPWLSSALAVIDTLVAEARAARIPYERMGLAGFSQGACLALEFTVRHPRRYAFVAGLSGALIGPTSTARDAIDLRGTPVLLACAEHDAHIPIEYLEHSAAAFTVFNAEVTRHIFPGSAHTIYREEIDWLKSQVADLPRVA